MKRKRRALKALTFEKAFEGYEALEHPDGTFTIQNFPIFGEVAADSNGNKIAATPEWLRAALDRSLKLQAEGFAGPAHVGHHGNWDALGQAADERERVGALVLRDLRPYRVEGKVEQTIFADLAEVSAEKFSRIQKGELPHVSVEYIEEHRPAIDSLAMTGSACPFKRYPNMKISKVTKAPKPTCYTVVAPAPPASAATFFEVPEKKGDPKDEKKSAPPATENAGNQDAQKQPPAGDPSTGGQQAGQQDGSQNAQDAAVGTAPPWAQAIVNGYGAMLQTIQAIAIKLGATLTPGALSGPVTLPPTPVSPVLNTVQEPAAPAMDAKTFGELHGVVQTLLRKDQAREKEAATTLSVATFEAKCKGWNFTDSDRVALRKCVEAGGEIAAQAFVDAIKKSPKEMAGRASDFRANNEPVQDSPAVMTYVSKGPAMLETARRFSVIHSQLVAAGMNPSPEDKFLEHQFATASDLHRANVILKGEQ